MNERHWGEVCARSRVPGWFVDQAGEREPSLGSRFQSRGSRCVGNVTSRKQVLVVKVSMSWNCGRDFFGANLFN